MDVDCLGFLAARRVGAGLLEGDDDHAVSGGIDKMDVSLVGGEFGDGLLVLENLYGGDGGWIERFHVFHGDGFPVDENQRQCSTVSLDVVDLYGLPVHVDDRDIIGLDPGAFELGAVEVLDVLLVDDITGKRVGWCGAGAGAKDGGAKEGEDECCHGQSVDGWL